MDRRASDSGIGYSVACVLNGNIDRYELSSVFIGVVFDSGDGVSHSVPVFEGYYLPHAVQRFTMAGYDVTMHLQKVFNRQVSILKFAIRRDFNVCCFSCVLAPAGTRGVHAHLCRA